MSRPRVRAAAALLLAGCSALAGCTAVLPAADPPGGLPEQPPRVLCEASWDGERVTVTVSEGDTIDGDWTSNLTLSGAPGGATLWASTVAPDRARGTFPVAPGDSLTDRVPAGEEELRLVASGPEGARTLCRVVRGEEVPDGG